MRIAASLFPLSSSVVVSALPLEILLVKMDSRPSPGPLVSLPPLAIFRYSCQGRLPNMSIQPLSLLGAGSTVSLGNESVVSPCHFESSSDHSNLESMIRPL